MTPAEMRLAQAVERGKTRDTSLFERLAGLAAAAEALLDERAANEALAQPRRGNSMGAPWQHEEPAPGVDSIGGSPQMLPTRNPSVPATLSTGQLRHLVELTHGASNFKEFAAELRREAARLEREGGGG